MDLPSSFDDYFTFHEFPLLYRDKRLVQSWTHANTSPVEWPQHHIFIWPWLYSKKKNHSFVPPLLSIWVYKSVFCFNFYPSIFNWWSIVLKKPKRATCLLHSRRMWEKFTVSPLYLNYSFRVKGWIVLPLEDIIVGYSTVFIQLFISFVIHLLWLQLGTFTR